MAALKPFVEDLEKELTCSICCDIFTNPKALPCMHSYCTKCIVQWYERSGNQVTKRFNCPICKTRIDVPEGDASKLRSSFYFDALLQLLHAMRSKSNQDQTTGVSECQCCEKPLALVAFCPQCNGMICDDCVIAHKTLKQLRAEHQPTMLNEFKQENVDIFIKNQMLCKVKFHEKNKLEYYCQEETCNRCICQKCFALSHQNHRMQSLEEAAEQVKQVIQQDVNRLNQLKEKYEQELQQSKKNMERIQSEIDLAKKEVDDAVEMICKIARQHGRATKNALDETLHDQTKANDDEQSDINTGIIHLSEFVLHCQTLLDRSVAYEIIESKKVLQQQCQIFFETPSILCSKPIQHDMTVHYVTNHQVMQSLRDIGKIVKSVTDPSQSQIKTPKHARCGFFSTFNIITRNTEGEVCHTRIESIDVKIKDVEGNEVEKKVFDEQSGKYRVSYKAEKAAPYLILVNIGGELIKNSPHNVNTLDVTTAFKPVKTFGENGHGKGQLNRPQSIALSDNGEIAITDYGNNRIQIFSLDGKYLREFGRKWTRKCKLFKPGGVIFNEDRIFVNDQPDNKGRIQKFDLNGTYVRTIYRTKKWFHPRGMCVNDVKNLAMCCLGNEELGITPSIKLLSKQGDLIHEFYSTDQYESPLNITCGNGKYFVSYFDKNFIRVFDKNGVFLCKFGEKGGRDGQFNGIAGLAVYGPDMILVCDVNNHRVQLLTQEGQFIRSFGSYGPGVGQLNGPTDVVVTADGQVFVTESGGNRVQVWC